MLSKLKSGAFGLMMGLLMGAVVTGSLLAGDLEPPTAPAPTMKTLEEIPPTWNRRLPVHKRFVTVLVGGEAVLDFETGLVWERSPLADHTQIKTWAEAVDFCYTKFAADRKGWRLPTIWELSSLVDGSNFLPAGHPFQLSPVQEFYWSATTSVADASQVYVWNPSLRPGNVKTIDKEDPFGRLVWCVRGGHGQGGGH